MVKKDIDQPEDFDKKVDHLLENAVISIARDIEKDYFKGMNQEQFVKTFYSRYAGLFMSPGCIETPKRIYRNLFVKYEELLDEEKKKVREKRLEFRYKVYWGVAFVCIVILGGLLFQYFGLDIKILKF